MKKVYSKPEIFFESFSLSQNIAAGCEVKPDDPILELTGIGHAFSISCSFDVTNGGGDGEFNGVCYHVFNNDGKYNVHIS